MISVTYMRGTKVALHDNQKILRGARIKNGRKGGVL